MNTKEARKQLKREIAALNRAYSDEAWKGCQPPEDWPYYEKNLANAKRRVDKAIDKLILASAAVTSADAPKSPGPLSFGTR